MSWWEDVQFACCLFLITLSVVATAWAGLLVLSLLLSFFGAQ